MTISANWNGSPSNPEALVLIDMASDAGIPVPGTTVLIRDASGQHFGCRDVGASPSHDGIVAAWIRHEVEERGLVLVDLRSVRS